MSVASRLESLVARAGRSGDAFVLHTSLSGAGFVGWALFSAVVACLSGRACLLESHTKVFLGELGLSLVAAIVTGLALRRAHAMVTSRIRPAIVVTPLLIVQTDLAGGVVSLFRLADVARAKVTHHYLNGSYTHSTFCVTFRDGTSLDFQADRDRDICPTPALAEQVADSIDTARRRIERARSDPALARRLAAWDWVSSVATS